MGAHSGARSARKIECPAAEGAGDAAMGSSDRLCRGSIWRAFSVRPARADQAGGHRRVDVGGEQVRTDLVVQVAGDVGALLVLQGEYLLLQRAVAVAHGGKALGHLVDPAAQADELRRPLLGRAGGVVAGPDHGQHVADGAHRPQRPADQRQTTARRRAGERQHQGEVEQLRPDRRGVVGVDGRSARPPRRRPVGAGRRTGRDLAGAAGRRTRRAAAWPAPAGGGEDPAVAVRQPAPAGGGCRRRWRRARSQVLGPARRSAQVGESAGHAQLAARAGRSSARRAATAALARPASARPTPARRTSTSTKAATMRERSDIRANPNRSARRPSGNADREEFPGAVGKRRHGPAASAGIDARAVDGGDCVARRGSRSRLGFARAGLGAFTAATAEQRPRPQGARLRAIGRRPAGFGGGGHRPAPGAARALDPAADRRLDLHHHQPGDRAMPGGENTPLEPGRSCRRPAWRRTPSASCTSAASTTACSTA